LETIESAIGAIARPWQVRRIGKAEGDVQAYKIIAEATAKQKIEDTQRAIKASAALINDNEGGPVELCQRAISRFISIEERRQENIENICAVAAHNMQQDVSDDKVEPDWTAKFFDDCKDVSNEAVQNIWGRILAGEVAKPGSYSMSTLTVLKNLDPRDAHFFNILALQSFRREEWDEYVPFVMKIDNDYLLKRGFAYSILQDLHDAGLIRLGVTPYSYRIESHLLELNFIGIDNATRIRFTRNVQVSAEQSQIYTGLITYARAGKELLPLVYGECNADFVTTDTGHAWFTHGGWNGPPKLVGKIG
jgi:hypothetical protein